MNELISDLMSSILAGPLSLSGSELAKARLFGKKMAYFDISSYMMSSADKEVIEARFQLLPLFIAWFDLKFWPPRPYSAPRAVRHAMVRSDLNQGSVIRIYLIFLLTRYPGYQHSRPPSSPAVDALLGGNHHFPVCHALTRSIPNLSDIPVNQQVSDVAQAHQHPHPRASPDVDALLGRKPAFSDLPR
jgi:hypothetical protein